MEERIRHYLKRVAGELDDLPDAEVVGALRELDGRIRSEIETHNGGEAHTALAVLARLGSPEEQAEKVRQRLHVVQSDTPAFVSRPEPDLEETTDIRWLGVCRSLAERFSVSVHTVRWTFVVLGMTGPMALLVYIISFALLKTSRATRDTLPQVDFRTLTKRTSGVLGVWLLLAAGVPVALAVAERGVLVYTALDTIALGPWGWFEEIAVRSGGLSFLFVLPLSLLGGLPVVHDWDKTFQRLAKAVVAVYALFVAIGVASGVVGMLVQVGQYYLFGR